jgi:alkanesulfonate monooxygenase SsuD/methylene tetrahydromethanopterin reductase-like flavin-dependent oxidoreductase (luciferase family)
VRHGLTLPIFDDMADPGVLADLAVEAEDAGWDGVFLWDHVNYRSPTTRTTDPWTALAAMADRTERITLGPMVTPLARRRPHIVARQVLALDHLSGGRFVLGAGLGLDSSGGELSKFGEETDDRRRADMLDEALELVRDLISGEPVDHHGTHFTASDVQFRPPPVNGSIPIWVAARWPNRRPLRRAARYDGVFVIDLEPPELADAVRYVRSLRPPTPYDVVVQVPPDSDPGPWQDAGATWWLAAFDPFTVTPSSVRGVIDRGPPSR